MRRLVLALSLFPLLAGTPAVFADLIPYSPVGTPAATMSITATTTGSVTMYFVPAGQTGGLDTINFTDLTTGVSSAYFFPNQNNTAAGAAVSFSVNAGDQLAFSIKNNVFNLSSDPALNSDGLSYAYMTNFSGGTVLLNSFLYPSGVFVGMEDLGNGFGYTSNYDYNDMAFIITNATIAVPTTSAVPEPGTLSLLATGVLGAAGFARRKFFNR
jgi:hypothetical protein